WARRSRAPGEGSRKPIGRTRRRDMSHVHEGALHAYLDGALDELPAGEARRVRMHLERCGTCRQRLERERAVRSEAEAILAGARPSVDLPTLEELRLLAESGR